MSDIGSILRGATLACLGCAMAVWAAGFAAADQLDRNLLLNHSFENSSASGWSGDYGRRSTQDAGPQDGQYYYFAGQRSWATLYQNVSLDLGQLVPWRRDTGGYYLAYGGYQAGCGDNDQGQIKCGQFDAGGTWITDAESKQGFQKNGKTWTWYGGTARLDPAATKIQFKFDADRNSGNDNNAYLDNTYLGIAASDIWTRGRVSHEHYGKGDWTVDEGHSFTLWINPEESDSPVDIEKGALYVMNGTTVTNAGFAQFGGGTLSEAYLILDYGGGFWGQRDMHFGWYGCGEAQVKAGGRLTTDGTVSLGGTTESSWKPGSGRIRVMSGGRWTSNGDVVMGLDDPSMTGYAAITVEGGTWHSHGQVLMRRGRILVTGGAWNCHGPVTVLDGDIMIEGGTASFSKPLTTASGWLYVYGGRVNVFDGFSMGAQRISLEGGHLYVPGDVNANVTSYDHGTLQCTGRLTGLGGDLTQYYRGAPRHVMLTGPAALWSVTDLKISRRSSVYLDGGTFRVVGGTAEFAMFIPPFGDWESSTLQFADNGGTVELAGGHLLYPNKGLDLNGGRISGNGTITLHASGMALGSESRPGVLIGTSPSQRLVVNGSVDGWGELTNVLLKGNMGVGNSPGEVTLEHATFLSTSVITMEVFDTDPDQYDRLLLGEGVDFAGATINISFAGGFLPGDEDVFGLFGETAPGGLAALDTADIVPPADWYVNTATGELVPEPATVAFLVAGAMAALWRRRR